VLDRCKELYDKQLRKHFGTPNGCTEAQISEIERSLHHPLPRAYREYLEWMGAHHQGPFRGSDWFAKDVFENTRYVPELLRQNGLSCNLSEGILSFFCHQGYMCAWFDLHDVKDDPSCWFYREGDMQQPEMVGAFSSFLLRELEQAVAVRSSRGF
jgi:hypothetical protein